MHVCVHNNGGKKKGRKKGRQYTYDKYVDIYGDAVAYLHKVGLISSHSHMYTFVNVINTFSLHLCVRVAEPH